jgi:hypothetical protein
MFVKILDVGAGWVTRTPGILLWSVLFWANSARTVAESLPEKGPRDSIVQPAPSGAEGSSASDKVYAKNGSTVTVSSGGSCGNWLDARKFY